MRFPRNEANRLLGDEAMRFLGVRRCDFVGAKRCGSGGVKRCNFCMAKRSDADARIRMGIDPALQAIAAAFTPRLGGR